MGNNMTTTLVQQGETLSMYANMYGCTVEELKKQNPGKVDSKGQIKAGATLVIPIGEKVSKLPSKQDSLMQRKLYAFNERVNEAHMKLYNPKLSSQEREKLEQEYIDLMKQKKARDEAATVSISADGIHFDVKFNRRISVAEFRQLFPECNKNFYDYASETKQRTYVQGEGFKADPENVYFNPDQHIQLKTQEYSHQGVWQEFKTSVNKTLGWSLD